MRATTCTTLASCVLLFAACETYKAEETPGAAGEPPTAGATDTSAEPEAAKPAEAAAQGREPGSTPSCDAVVAHLVTMTEKQIAELDEEERARAAAVVPMIRTQISEACTSSNWSAAFKSCIVAAMDEASLRACDRLAPEPAAPAAVKIPPDEPAEPAAVAVDGPACEDVVKHVIDVALNAPDIPPEQREQMKAVLPEQRQLMMQACDTAPWSSALRTCLLKAHNAASIQGCRTLATP